MGSGDTGWGGGGGREVLIEQLRSWQLPQKKREELFHWTMIGEVEWGRGGLGLATTAASPQFTTEIYNSVQKHVVRNWDGPDAKAFAGIYKSNWVCSAVLSATARVRRGRGMASAILLRLLAALSLPKLAAWIQTS